MAEMVAIELLLLRSSYYIHCLVEFLRYNCSRFTRHVTRSRSGSGGLKEQSRDLQVRGYQSEHMCSDSSDLNPTMPILSAVDLEWSIPSRKG